MGDLERTGPVNPASRDDPTPPGPATSHPTSRVLLLACLPAISLGLLIRIWVARSQLMVLTSDEAFTGLQAFEALRGRIRFVPDGNDYGATSEALLLAPILAVWTGVWPMRAIAMGLSAAAGYALYRLALPFYGRVVAAVVALVGWTMSGTVVQVWSHLYMGYATGFVALVATQCLACRAVNGDDRLPQTAVLAGIAAGVAMWSHPMFGLTAGLALVVPALYRFRAVLRWWLPLTGGWLLGMAPWLGYLAVNGVPRAAAPLFESTFEQRIVLFVTQLLPRVLGLRGRTGDWLRPQMVAVGLCGVLMAASVAGLVVLVRRCGRSALPLLVTGLAIYPSLAVLPPLAYADDGRYGLPFLPTILMGLAAWMLLVPVKARASPWTVVVVPTLWTVLSCLPILGQQIGWGLHDPDVDARRVVAALHDRHIQYLGGDYWATYLVDYLDDARLITAPHLTVRLDDEAHQLAAADPTAVAYVYPSGMTPSLPMERGRYDLVVVGSFDLYVPQR